MPHSLPPVDDDVFEALQRLAEPLVDDVNSVLRRLLSLNGAATASVGPPAAPSAEVGSADPTPRTVTEAPTASSAQANRARRTTAKKKATKPKKARAPRGSLLPESEYELPMLQFLVDAGGRAPASEVVDAIGTKLKGRFTPADLEPLDSGDIRWKSRTQFVRLKLIKEGAMVKDAPRGIWEVSELGRSRVNGTAQ